LLHTTALVTRATPRSTTRPPASKVS